MHYDPWFTLFIGCHFGFEALSQARDGLAQLWDVRFFYSHPVTPRQLNKITVMTTISDDQAYLLTHRGVQGL